MKTVISLCDLTGNMTKPWVDAGYHALLVDPQHGTTRTETMPNGARITRFAGTIEDAMPLIATHSPAATSPWCSDSHPAPIWLSPAPNTSSAK